VSDITKKIFSIESSETEPRVSDMVRSVNDPAKSMGLRPAPEDVPEFVTREEIVPRKAPPSVAELTDETQYGTGWILWMCLGFGLLWIMGAGLLFGLPMLSETTPSLLKTTGLVLLLALPLVLIVLLWIALRRLISIARQNARMMVAAEILISPEKEALGRTQTLSSGIRSEIAKINTQLADTVDALQGVQSAITSESQALDATGLQLSSRSEDVGRNLTLQRQALESIAGTFDTRMETLSANITDISKNLEDVCGEAETKLTKAGEALTETSTAIGDNIETRRIKLEEDIERLGDASQKMDLSSGSLSDGFKSSVEQLTQLDAQLIDRTKEFESLNALAHERITDLQATIGHGNQMLSELQESTSARQNQTKEFYESLNAQLKQSEDETLTVQGKTARMVETNLAQMRRDFGRMESDLQALQSKLNSLREGSSNLPVQEEKPTRLHLKPLESDFPPVEPPRPPLNLKKTAMPEETPLNLGVDMEIETPEAEISAFDPDVIRRPGGELLQKDLTKKSTGFGQRKEKPSSGWRWRDMLGTLDRPDTNTGQTVAAAEDVASNQSSSIINTLSSIQLSPSAIVDEGTVIDATQARINDGEAGLINTVSSKLPDAVTHLRNKLADDPALAAELQSFSAGFAQMVGNTPPTAPALRAAFSSPDGRAYLLCAAALRG